MPSVSCRHKTIAEAVLTLLRWANAIQDELGKALDTMEGMVALATPLFLPREFHGERRLVGYSQWGCKELDPTELLTLIFRGKKA